MRDAYRLFLEGQLPRREFLKQVIAAGLSAAAAQSFVSAAEAGEPQTGAADQGRSGVSLVTGTGGDLLVEQLRAAGVRFIFTNPGSHEVGIFDALATRPDVQVLLGLHEGIVVPMADGYHRITRQPGFVIVHAIAGTAQMAGQLYNAHRDGSSLIVTAALADPSVYSDDVVLAARPGFHQTEINRQFTKISWEIRNGASIPVATRRAFKVAATPPGGPVYAAYGMNALSEEKLVGEIWSKGSFLQESSPRPAKEQIEVLIRLVAQAKRPIVFFGDEVWKAGAQAEAIALCELLALPVATGLAAPSMVFMQAFCNFPVRHPLCVGTFSPDRPYPAGSADLVLMFGARDFGGWDLPERPPFGQAQLVMVGIDGTLGRTQPSQLIVVANVRAALRDLIDGLKGALAGSRLRKLRESRERPIRDAVARARQLRLEAAAKNAQGGELHPDLLVKTLDEVADPNAIIVSECFSPSNDLFNLGSRPGEKTWITNAGYSLGWGVGAAMGVKIGAPDRQVILSIGDGALMYSAPGFWTMRRYEIPILVVVWNNQSYQMVRTRFHRSGPRMARTGHYHGTYIGSPDIDFVQLARSQGVDGERVLKPGALKAAIARGLAETKAGRPYVLDVALGRVGEGAQSTWYQSFSVADQRHTKI